jgi:hypothetical protein
VGPGDGLPDLWDLAWELGGLVGIDPTDRTLRELYLAAAGAWDRVTGLMSFVAAANGGKVPHPDRLNPYRRRPKTEEQKRLEHKEGMLALKTGLRTMARGR